MWVGAEGIHPFRVRRWEEGSFTFDFLFLSFFFPFPISTSLSLWVLPLFGFPPPSHLLPFRFLNFRSSSLLFSLLRWTLSYLVLKPHLHLYYLIPSILTHLSILIVHSRLELLRLFTLLSIFYPLVLGSRFCPSHLSPSLSVFSFCFVWLFVLRSMSISTSIRAKGKEREREQRDERSRVAFFQLILFSSLFSSTSLPPTLLYMLALLSIKNDVDPVPRSGTARVLAGFPPVARRRRGIPSVGGLSQYVYRARPLSPQDARSGFFLRRSLLLHHHRRGFRGGWHPPSILLPSRGSHRDRERTTSFRSRRGSSHVRKVLKRSLHEPCEHGRSSPSNSPSLRHGRCRFGRS